MPSTTAGPDDTVAVPTADGGHLTIAALRHRPRQAGLVLLLAALVSASAVVGPLYSRASEQSVLASSVHDDPAGSALVVSTTPTTASTRPPAPPPRLATTVRSVLPTAYGPPVLTSSVDVTTSTVGTETDHAALRSGAAPGRLVSRSAVCRHLHLVAGRCLRAGGEVLVDVQLARRWQVSPGSPLMVIPSASTTSTGPARLQVVGVVDPPDRTSTYWAITGSTGTDGAVTDLYAQAATVAAVGGAAIRTSAIFPLTAQGIRLDRVDAVRVAVPRADELAHTVNATATSGVAAVLDRAAADVATATTIAPLLAVQLAVLGIVVLGFVCAAVTEARRPEIALARLRGHGTRGALAMLLRELGSLVAVGVLVGMASGWLLAVLAAREWLADGVTLELRPPVLLAGVAALVVGLVVVVVTGLPTLRQPLTALLRTVPPRASALRVGAVEGAVLALAAAGFVTLVAGGGGPVALLAPELLAVAGGLLLGTVVVPLCSALARHHLSRGTVSSALAAVQLARRPALRRLVAIVTVATALLVFTVDIAAVAARNRSDAAQVETGAPVVLHVAVASPRDLRRAVLAVDPTGAFATPVVTVSSATDAGPRTTAVEPNAFARFAQWTQPAVGRAAVRRLTASVRHLPLAVHLTGDQVAVTAAVRLAAAPTTPGGRPPALKPVHLLLGVERATGGGVVDVDLGVVPQSAPAGPMRYRAPMPCTAGCLLRRITVARTFGDFQEAEVRLTVTALADGAGSALTPVDLDAREGAWVGATSAGEARSNVNVLGGRTLQAVADSFGPPVSVQRGDRPAAAAAVATGELPRAAGDTHDGRQTTAAAPDLTGVDTGFLLVGRVRVVPRSGARGVVVPLAALASGAPGASGRTAYDVWLAADDPAREQQLRAALAGRGVTVTGRDTTARHAAALGRRASAVALKIAIPLGVLALLLGAAGLLVGAATSRAARARDLWGLRLTGVPAAVVRVACVREQLTVAALGAVTGAALGLVAAAASLPSLPQADARFGLASAPGRSTPVDLTVPWTAVLVSGVLGLVLLLTTAVVVGRALASAADSPATRRVA